MSHLNVRTIPLNKLTAWNGNVRKTGIEEGLDELTASIAAHGLLQSLVVKKAARDKYAVVAGQRRHLALLALQREGKLQADMPVDCRLVGEGADAAEISLAENVVRQPMHPADQFEAWRALADRGMDIATIAARFGVAEMTVVKRLKLGRVNPEILAIYRQGDMGLEQVQAFAVSDDPAEQLRVWNGLQTWQRQPDAIRRALSKDDIPATDKRVQLIGLDAYEAEGGATRRDLFDERNAGWVSDAALLEQMVTERLEAEAETIRAEGWKWVEVRADFGWEDRRDFRIDRGEQVPLTTGEEAEQNALYAEFEALNECDAPTDEDIARLDAIEARLNVLANRPFLYQDAVKAIAGTIVWLGHDGRPEVERGLIRKEDAPEQDGSGNPKQKSPFSAALTQSLTREVTGALQVEFAANPKLALVAIVHAYLLSRRNCSPCHALALKVSGSIAMPVEGSAAEQAFAKLEQKALKGAPETDPALWDWLAKRKPDRLLEILAVLTARYVDGGASQSDRMREAFDVDLRKWFTPTAKNYFGRISTAQIHSDLRETGNETLLSKKAELAGFAERRMKEEGAAAWLPVPMRTKPPMTDADIEELFSEDDDLDDEMV